MTHYLKKFLLEGKTVFVAGGAGLIGSEISLAFAQAKAKAVILDKDSGKAQKIIKKNPSLKLVYEYFDITDLDGLEINLNKLFRKYKRVDVWANAAYPKTSDRALSIKDITLESLMTNIHWQLTSSLWTSRLVALFMKEHRIKGSIIHLGSIYGVVANDFSLYEGTAINPPYAYPAIKGGIINLTKSLASYFGKDEIRVNCISPGGVFDNQDKKFVKKYAAKVPFKRMARPEEVASVALFLGSDASSYITGTNIIVDGGWVNI